MATQLSFLVKIWLTDAGGLGPARIVHVQTGEETAVDLSQLGEFIRSCLAHAAAQDDLTIRVPGDGEPGAAPSRTDDGDDGGAETP